MIFLLLYFFSLVMRPTDLYATFPKECLGQNWEENAPIKTVCIRAANIDNYNFKYNIDYPIGFKTTNLYNDIQEWLENHMH